MLRLLSACSLKMPVCQLPLSALLRVSAPQARSAIYGSSPCGGLRQILMNCLDQFLAVQTEHMRCRDFVTNVTDKYNNRLTSGFAAPGPSGKR